MVGMGMAKTDVMVGCGWMGGCRSLLVAFLLLAQVVHDISDGLFDVVDAFAWMGELVPI